MSLSLSCIVAALVAQGYNAVEQDGIVLITTEEGLDAYLALQGEQIIVESILFAENAVADVSLLNAEILRTHQLVPLTTVGIKNFNGEDYYVAFGALSSESAVGSVVIEVDALIENVAGLVEAYAEYIS